MQTKEKIVLNKFGFYSLQKKPSLTELKKYYAKKYYQVDRTTYQKVYSKEEILYINNKIEQKYLLIQKLLSKKNRNPRLLDVGCGEGFALSFFNKLNWDVMGLDFSKFGLMTHNPNMEKQFIDGDLYDNIKTLKAKKDKFDLIWAGNILEHVLDPMQLLINCYDLASKNGILMIEVPNDFSTIQIELKKRKLINNDYWIILPDHISYFNKEGLVNICSKANWRIKKIITDFPIDFNLFNPNANYVVNKKNGKGAHLQRLQIDNLMHRISIKKTNKFYEAMADLGLGRSIIGIFKK